VFCGPASEELIVSGSMVEGSGSLDESAPIRQGLFDNALKAVEQAAAHPDLEITKPFARDDSISHVDCWTIHAQTRSGDIMLSEAVVTGDRGVLLITF
jgi:hypothetical protein